MTLSTIRPGSFAMAIFFIMLSAGCKKSNTSNPSGPGTSAGNTALLVKTVFTTSATGSMDTAITTYSYNGNQQLINAELKTSTSINNTATGLFELLTTDVTNSYGYAASGLRTSAVTVSNSTTSVYKDASFSTIFSFSHDTGTDTTRFVYTGNLLTAYIVHLGSTDSLSIVGLPQPPTYSFNTDSAGLTYGSNGLLSTWTLHASNDASGTTTFTFNGNDLSNQVLVIPTAVGTETITTTYEYDDKVANNGLSVINNIPLYFSHNIVKMTQVSSGVYAETKVSTFTYTYDSQNRPVSSTETISDTGNGGSTQPTLQNINGTFTYMN